MKTSRLAPCICLVFAASALPVQSQMTGWTEAVQANLAPPTLRLSQSQGEPLATAGSTALTDTLNGQSQTARQTMVWAVHSSGLGFGIGVEQRNSTFAGLGTQRLSFDSTTPQAGMLMGLSMATGNRSYLTLQTPLLSSTARPSSEDGLLLQDARQLRMGLVFQTRNKYADLRQGLRMELSAQTTLSVRPRAGRLGFTVQSSW
nr:hypothetical protein [uncultured Roseateles sp.]